MDATGVGDSVVHIVQQFFPVNMAITYTGGDGETENLSYPYGTATAMNVGKSTLINNAMNYIDEGWCKFYTYTNKFFFTEVEGLVLGKTRMGHVTFTARWFDDITNAVMIGLYYIERERLRYKPVDRQRLVVPTIDMAYQMAQAEQAAVRHHHAHW